MENRINVKIKQCYDTEENYKANNPVLLAGQLAYTKDKYGKYKIGDGISHWNDLDYTENIFVGTQKEYEEKNAEGEISPGTIVYITDDRDYCNITIDKELSSTSPNLVENQAVKKALEALTYEDVGALPLHGISDNSLGIINSFKERPASCNIDFSDTAYKNKITYMLATKSMVEGKPPLDSTVINLGWDSGLFGAQLAINFYNPIHAYMRAYNTDVGGYKDWTEFITELNLSSFLQEATMSETAQTNGIMGLPASGAISGINDFKEWFQKARSGLYTAYLSYASETTQRWVNMLVIKHKNGNPTYGTADGDKYGMYIYTRMLEVANTDKAKDLIWNKMMNGEWYGERVILDEKNYKSYALPRVPEHNNEWNFGNWGAHSFYWFNYRDGITESVAANPIDTYIFGRGTCKSDDNNLAGIKVKGITNVGLTVNGGGSVVAIREGTAGTAGYVKLAQIKIISKWANFPCIFVITRRSAILPVLVSITYQSYDGYYPSVESFLQTWSMNFNVYLHNEGSGVWALYVQKNEGWGKVYILNEYTSADIFQVTHPNTQVSSLPSGCITATMHGEVRLSHVVRDSGNGNDIKFNYSVTAMNYGDFTWLAAWNGYTLQSTNKNNFMREVSDGTYWGMAPGGSVELWVRTSKLGIIPYQAGARGNGHQSLGTESWYFSKSYIDNMYGTAINLSGAATIAGTLTLTKTTDAAGAANNGPALIIGGTSATAHIEIDANEIMAKANGTTTATLYLNNDGGSVSIGNKLTITEGKISSNYVSGTWLAANKGNCILNSTAPAGYNGLIRVKSSNGVFTVSGYNAEFGLQYTTDATINANTNAATKRAILLNESGNSSFPGTVSANSFSAGGSSSLTTLTATNVTVNGSLRLKNSGNYGMKLNFGDGDYVYFYEDTDDHLKIYVKNGIKFECASGNGITFDSSRYTRFGNIYAVAPSSNYFDVRFNNQSTVGIGYHCYDNNEYMWFLPLKDNRGYLGSSDTRWTQIYCMNSSISTSDAREKKEISYIGKASGFEDTYMSDETLTKFVNGLLACIFKRINGESGRPHHGFIAQDVEKLLKELNIKDHAGFIKSPVEKDIETTDENGNKVIVKEIVEGEYTYGLRYEEFIPDLTRYCQILYKKNEELENIQKTQEKKIQELEARFSDMEAKLNKLLTYSSKKSPTSKAGDELRSSGAWQYTE